MKLVERWKRVNSLAKETKPASGPLSASERVEEALRQIRADLFVAKVLRKKVDKPLLIIRIEKPDLLAKELIFDDNRMTRPLRLKDFVKYSPGQVALRLCRAEGLTCYLQNHVTRDRHGDVMHDSLCIMVRPPA